MRFEEIALYEAIQAVYRVVENPRSRDWLRPPEDDKLCRLIHAKLPVGCQFLMPQTICAWDNFGKSATITDGIKKLDLIVRIAKAHGRQCFWANRGLGNCVNEVTIDRLIPGTRDGAYSVENCVLACAFHNVRRGDKSVEEYLASTVMPLWPLTLQKSDPKKDSGPRYVKFSDDWALLRNRPSQLNSVSLRSLSYQASRVSERIAGAFSG